MGAGNIMSLDDASKTHQDWHHELAELFNDSSLQPQRIELAAGTVIHEAGSTAENVYSILQGQVRLYLPGPAPERTASGRLLEILGPGQWFGYGALSPSRSNIARAVAVVRTVVTVVPAERFLNLLSTRPAAAVQVVQHLAEAVRAAREDSGRLVFDDCNQRLINTLLRFATSAAARRQDDGETILQITHEQLAQAVGVARETVSLALTEFRHQNLVRTGRNQLVFNTGALQEFGQRLRHNGTNGSNGNGRREMAASN